MMDSPAIDKKEQKTNNIDENRIRDGVGAGNPD
jgi:hypothetical protein